MTPDNFRETLRLLDRALALLARREPLRRARLRREVRGLALELDLLRTRLGQPCATRRRN